MESKGIYKLEDFTGEKEELGKWILSCQEKEPECLFAPDVVEYIVDNFPAVALLDKHCADIYYGIHNVYDLNGIYIEVYFHTTRFSKLKKLFQHQHLREMEKHIVSQEVWSHVIKDGTFEF